LRLEWQEGVAKALCSADGVQWYRIGEIPWEAREPILVGMHAIGDLDRMVYPGRHAEGTVIRFRDIRVWGRDVAGEDAGLIG
jgi:hypothetical protein